VICSPMRMKLTISSCGFQPAGESRGEGRSRPRPGWKPRLRAQRAGPTFRQVRGLSAGPAEGWRASATSRKAPLTAEP
jgi:hypothetical protein